MYYKQAVEKNQHRNPKPIRLEIGEFEKFEGVEFEGRSGDCCNCEENFYDEKGGFAACNCSYYDDILIIKCNKKYLDYFEMNEFIGEKFKLYAETHGANFQIIGKDKSKRKRKYFNTKIVYL